MLPMRFGLDGDPEPQPRAAISRRLGLSLKEVRAVEKRALSALARLRELEAISDAA
jgi:DNA-directed RNA polymerase sigma subunit (sigma70/sigma32)